MVDVPNPFQRKDSHGKNGVLAYKVLTILSWLLVVVTSFYYVANVPTEGKYTRRTIFGQSNAHDSPFTPSHPFVGIYWIVLFIAQAVYVYHLFSAKEEYVNHAADLGSHFIMFNLLQFGTLMLWVRSHFVWAEVLIVVNLGNLLSLYLRHPTKPRFIHIGAISGPLAYIIVALFWDGAVMVGARDLPARIVANVFIWSFLLIGWAFILLNKDYTMGFALSFWMAALGVGQFAEKIFALQWIFAFAIMGTLFVSSVLIAFPGVSDKFSKKVDESTAGEDAERQPLLNED